MLVKALLCQKCNTVVWSKHRHDWQPCNCKEGEGQIFVDGGRDYFRWGAGKDSKYIEILYENYTKSIYVPSKINKGEYLYVHETIKSRNIDERGLN